MLRDSDKLIGIVEGGWMPVIADRNCLRKNYQIKKKFKGIYFLNWVHNSSNDKLKSVNCITSFDRAISC